MSATADYTIRVTCPCATCTDNAERMGQPTPLAAFTRPATATALGITEKNAGRKGKTHGLVHAAHDPSLAGWSAPIAIPA